MKINKIILVLFAMVANITVANCQNNNENADKLNSIASKLKQSQQKPAVADVAGYPTTKQIEQDLVGHSLAEGVPNGYRPDDWRWVIEKGQVKNLKVVEVLKRTKDTYIFNATMLLATDYYSYDTSVKIKYAMSKEGLWEMDYVLSQGMYIVITHEYDSCLKTSLADDGWGGVHCLQLTNVSEVTIAVGGDYLSYGGWERFTTVVAPHSSSKVGGTFAGGDVKDYRINFITRIN